MKWPTREGISVPVTEIDLPQSQLNLWIPQNFENHHNEWVKSRMAEHVITQTLRDLRRHQFPLPKDVHRQLHKQWAPPEFPTPEQAMKEVMEAYDAGEYMRIYSIEDKRYVPVAFDEARLDALREEYSRFRR